jgi:hypothetical protein
MSEKVCKVLFLTVPDGAAAEPADAFGRRVAEHLPGGEIRHEFVEVGPGRYDEILDRLEAGVLPVVLKSARTQGGG